MTTKYEELTNGWKQIGIGPAYMDAEAITHIHFGNEEPASDSKAYHKIGFGFMFGISVQSAVPIWARSEQAVGGIVISESAS